MNEQLDKITVAIDGDSVTTADFKARIAAIMRLRETGKKYSVIGGPRAHECVVRRNTGGAAAKNATAPSADTSSTKSNI